MSGNNAQSGLFYENKSKLFPCIDVTTHIEKVTYGKLFIYLHVINPLK